MEMIIEREKETPKADIRLSGQSERERKGIGSTSEFVLVQRLINFLHLVSMKH